MPDCSAYHNFYKELDDPEKYVEHENEDRELLYAVPRWIVITEHELNGMNDKIKDNPLMRQMLQVNLQSPNTNEMYWFWSMKSDLGDQAKIIFSKK